MPDSSWVPKRAIGSYTRLVDGQTLLVLYTKVCGTNPTGGLIWSLCGTGLSVQEIVAKVAADTGADATDSEHEVHRFIDHLSSEGFLV
jgi:hypothetical protein